MKHSEVPPGEISAILATPPGLNSGMVAAELALLAFAKRHGIHTSLNVYQLCSLEERLRDVGRQERDELLRRAKLPLSYTSLREKLEQALSGSVLLFWGDFLHMAQYHRALQRAMVGMRGIPNIETAVAMIDRVFLLKGAPESVLDKTLSFGTTLLFNTLTDEIDAEYGVPLERFLKGIRRIWVRDVVSAAKVAHLRQDYRTAYWGCDCALLLRREDLALCGGGAGYGNYMEPEAGNQVLVFLGRTPQLASAMFEVAKAIAAHLGAVCRWLPWGSSTAFPGIDWDTLPLGGAEGEAPNVITLLSFVANSRAVVTDTYHLALIAWNFGVPAILLTSPFNTSDTNVSSGAAFNWRDKREVLFSQYNAMDFLIRPEELDNERLLERRIGRVLDRIEDPGHIWGICNRMHTHAREVETVFAGALRSLLGFGNHARSFR